MNNATKHNATTHNNKPMDVLLCSFLLDGGGGLAKSSKTTHHKEVHHTQIKQMPDVTARRLNIAIIQPGDTGLVI